MLSVSICLSVCVYICPSLSLFVSLCLYVFLSASVFFCLSLSVLLSVYLWLCLSVYLYLSLSVCCSPVLFVYLFVFCLSVCLYLSICLSTISFFLFRCPRDGLQNIVYRVCLSVCSNCTTFSVYVTCGRDSVLHWQQCSKLCFVDDIMVSHKLANTMQLQGIGELFTVICQAAPLEVCQVALLDYTPKCEVCHRQFPCFPVEKFHCLCGRVTSDVKTLLVDVLFCVLKWHFHLIDTCMQSFEWAFPTWSCVSRVIRRRQWGWC